jgi:hypothetical protein
MQIKIVHFYLPKTALGGWNILHRNQVGNNFYHPQNFRLRFLLNGRSDLPQSQGTNRGPLFGEGANGTPYQPNPYLPRHA